MSDPDLSLPSAARPDGTTRPEEPRRDGDPGATQDAKELAAEQRRQQKMAALGMLMGGLAHEINTPVQYVGDNLNFLQSAIADLASLAAKFRQVAAQLPEESRAELREAEQRVDLDFLLQEMPQAIGQSQHGIARVRDIVTSIKRFSHPGSAERKLHDIREAAALAIELSVNQWKYVATVERNWPDDLPRVECDIGEINQVLLNLIVNAAHAIEERKDGKLGVIEVSIRAVENAVEIAVRDTGNGIRPEHAARIFERFFTTKESGRGTGQGLSLCHEVVVKDHQGKIWFDTEVGVGTTFTIRLPLQQPAA
jgi:signal transduction histidine kinase